MLGFVQHWIAILYGAAIWGGPEGWCSAVPRPAVDIYAVCCPRGHSLARWLWSHPADLCSPHWLCSGGQVAYRTAGWSKWHCSWWTDRSQLCDALPFWASGTNGLCEIPYHHHMTLPPIIAWYFFFGNQHRNWTYGILVSSSYTTLQACTFLRVYVQ